MNSFVLSLPQSSSVPDVPSNPGKGNDKEAIVTPLPQDADLMPASSDLSNILSPTSGVPRWRVPLISQRTYLSGAYKDEATFQTGSLPLDVQRPFDAEPLRRQSEEFNALRALLEKSPEDYRENNDAGSTLSGWTDQPIRTDAADRGSSENSSPNSSGSNFFSMTIESLGPTDSQRQLVQKAVLDLKRYIAVAQPNSQDIILQNEAEQRPLTVTFNSGDKTHADQGMRKDATYEDFSPVPIETSNNPASDYTRIFSVDNIWEFMTSSTMIAIYILFLALWAAWRYAIRRFV